MVERVHTVVVGGGQAGLAISYLLTQQGTDHTVLEQSKELAHAWRTGRWDSFMLNTPNWHGVLPGWDYHGSDPDGFGTKQDLIASLENYAASFQPPMRFGTCVRTVDARTTGDGYEVTLADGGAYVAQHVVIATGAHQFPRLPTMAAAVPGSVQQLHSSEYQKPQALPPGAVLVVGTSDSGCQIAEELNEAGRTVYLCVSRAGRRPRRYRGKDQFCWSGYLGLGDRPRATGFNPYAQNSSTKGGHTINLHQFANDGVRLLGQLLDVQGDTLVLAQDAAANLAQADRNCATWKQEVDDYIQRAGLDAPPPEPDPLDEARSDPGKPAPPSLHLSGAGIGSIIWATGYGFDFRWVHLPVFDETGFPVQDRGLTQCPGLYFLGVQGRARGTLRSVGDPAHQVAAAIRHRNRSV